MRPALIALPLLLAASPALADDRRPAPHAAPSPEAIAGALNSPLVQEGVAAMIGNVVDAVLATRVGPLAELAGPDTDIRPNDTLADIEARRDPDYRAKLHDSTRRGVATLGRTAKGAVAMSRELAATGARVQAALAPLMGALDTYAGPR
jgi:hypothetical protein